MYRPRIFRPASFAENRVAELTAIRRTLTRDEQDELTLRRKHVRQQAARRERYANDPEWRQAQIDRSQRAYDASRGIG